MLAAEHHRSMVEPNQTAADYPRDKCIHQLFEEQVERTPDAVAVAFEGQSLNYRELNLRANQLAHHLRQLGVGPEGLVGLYAERSLNLVVGLLATLKAGGAYLPLDPSSSRERLELMLEDARPVVLLTHKTLASHPLPTHAKVFQLDADWPSLASESSENLNRDVGSENPAYVIFTSGSTGRPKGVVIEHRHLVNYVAGIIQSLKLPPGLRFATVSTFAADLGHTVVFPSLVTGGQLHVIAEERAADPKKLAGYFHREVIEVLKIVPSHLRALLQSAPPGDAAHCLPRRILVLGGEVSDWGLIEQVWELAPACRVFNHYGPTETTVGVLVNDLQQPASAFRPPTVPLGKPLPNSRVYVVNPQLNPVEVGEPGELMIGGAGVARGYLNRPDMTAARFIPDPFSGDQTARLYRTGDRARWLPDGTVEFLGRMDHQVKIRGYRIEPGEVEAVMRRHPDLSACAVVTQDHNGAGKILAAFIVGREPADLSVASLRQWLEQKLPDYMIPSRFFLLPALPLTANGKVDRKALEYLDGVELAAGTSYVAPRTELERKLGEIWETVLRRERVGIDDNFFDLGGHSLLAVAIGSQITRQLDVEVPLRWMFDHPTIERLARQMESEEGRSKKARAIERADRQEPLPMSFAQQRMWLLQQTLENPATYNQPVALRLRGQVDRDRLRRALRVILERHEVLRTALVQQGESLVQQVAEANDIPLPWLEVDLQAVPPSQKQSALEERLLDEASRPFDLARAPLWRAVWITLAAEEQVLGITFHHSIVDEWTWRLLFQEWERLYAADGREELAGLPELPVQYADYAVWERQRLTGELLEQQRSYWSEQLQNLPPALELPSDMPRPLRTSGRGARHDFRLAGSVVTRLRELAREEGTTLFTVLLTAFQVWLHRYTGQNDVVVGTPIATRERPEVQELLGFFLNTLPIRVRLDARRNYREVLRQVRSTLWEAFGHADLPFDQMVKLAVTEREARHQPLYQVMFVLLENGYPSVRLGQPEARPLPVQTRTSKNDLTLSIEAVDDVWDCQFEYATELFSEETIGRMARHLTELLRSITNDPQQSISELNLLPGEEREQIIVEWNRTEQEYSRDKCVHQLFEAQVERTPEAVALIFADEQLTYRELNELANRVARYLSKRGVGPEILVGLCMERSLEMIVSLLGILKAGAGYVPLDPSYPKERLAFIMADAALPILVVQSSLLSKLPESAAQMVCFDTNRDKILAEDAEKPVSGVRPENLAYVIYTSGSTGQPKGVVVQHRGLCNVSEAQARAFHPGPGDRVLQFASISFDASIFEIVMALCHGAALCLGGQDELMPGPGLIDFLRDREVTIVTLPPSALAALPAAELPTLRVITVAGEACREELIAQWAPGRRFFNLYGPTESTIWATMAECHPDNIPAPIGRPIMNTQTYVLDQNLSPVPAGVAGELFIGGEGLARGYLNRPELTAQRFIANPFSEHRGVLLYKTGDLVRHRCDGNLEFLGRIDHQVKVRGFRIELGEIESVLRECRGVRAALVIAREDVPGDKRLVAYLVSDPEAAPTIRQLHTFLRQKLPDYMLPAAFVFLEALPLTTSGKIDRQALPAPDISKHPFDDEYAPPGSPIEERLCQIWAELLGVERVGVRHNFFELGGHSLLAIRLISRLRDELKIEVPLRTIFENQTISALAMQMAETIGPTSAPIPRAPRDAPLRLSFAQDRLWFLDQFAPNRAIYSIPMVLHLGGTLDADIFRRCLDEIVRRHESLRTRFAAVAGQPVQIIAPPGSLPMPLCELSDRSEVERHAEAVRHCAEEAQHPFDLAQDLLLRAKLFRLSETEHLLFLNVHHIAMDDLSMDVLVGELAALYDAFCTGQPFPLPELPIQYADFAAWQRDRLKGEALEKLLGYWRTQLQGAPTLLELPTDRPRPPVQSYRGAVETALFPSSLLDALARLSQQSGVSLFMTLLAAFQTLLSRYSGQEDIVVGSPMSGRSRTELEGLIGFFVNTVVLRSGFDGDPSFHELLRQVREVTLGAYAFQELPFEKLVEELRPERHLSYSPLCQVLFALQLPLGEWPHPAGLRLNVESVPAVTAKFDLSVAMSAASDGLKAAVEYSTDLFERETVARFLQHFRCLLEGVVADPAERVSKLPLLTGAERRQVLVEWNQTAADYPADRCIHELIEAQASRTPEAVALVFEERRLTYRQLDEQADRLASHLRKRGVGPEVLVGLCLERSIEMIIALLAILKAGGAYVPLDPSQPKERLKVMIEDSRSPLVITQRSLLASLPPNLATVEYLEVDLLLASDPPGPADGHPSGAATPANLAYVIYTSGSTGTPKAVAIEHRQLVNYVRGISQHAEFGEGWSFATVSSLSADLGNTAVFPALCTGGSLHVIAQERLSDPDAFAAYFDRHTIDCLKIVPSHLAALQTGAVAGSVMPKKCLILGGEPSRIEWVNQLQALAPHCVIFNHYGPTETTVGVLTYRVGREIPACPSGTLPLGRPLPNTRIYILDRHGDPVPIGVPGEIYIGGHGVGRGYLGRAEMTAERFLPDAFSDAPGDRLYRTGDRARYLADGNIEFLGRFDEQAKVRGFRIEPAEIEAALATHPLVRRAAILNRQPRAGESVLVAFVEGQPDPALSTSALRTYLRDRLPEYMIPGSFVFVENLPLTSSGKVNRQALFDTPIPDHSEPLHPSPPRTALESTLVQIWQEALGKGPIGIRDNFFDLGGHSLLAARIISEVRRTLGVNVSIAALFLYPNIEKLAANLPTGAEPESGVFIQLRSGSAPGKLIFVIGEFGMPLMHLAPLVGNGMPSFASVVSVPKAQIDAASAGRSEDLPSLEDLVSDHVEQILKHHSGGPCVLAGYCIEGVFAVEIARKLQALGTPVESVILFDSVIAPASLGWRFAVRGYGVWARRNLEFTLRHGPRYILNKINSRLRHLKVAPALKDEPSRAPQPNEDQASHFAHVNSVRKIYRHAQRNYRPQPMVCRGVICLSTDATGCAHDPSLGAQGVFAAGLEIVPVSGNHTTMLEEPHLRSLAAKITPLLLRPD